MHIPRKETLSEVIYRDIEKNCYLNEIYNSLIYNIIRIIKRNIEIFVVLIEKV